MESSVLYPALIYKSKNNSIFVANCIIKKIVGYGKTEIDAIKNLENLMNKSLKDYSVKVKPVYKLLPELDNDSFLAK